MFAIPFARPEIVMLKIVKDSVLKVSRSLGYDIVPLREMRERDFALHLRELLTRLNIDCVLDVGANVGQYRDFLRDRVFYEGIIVSFEPVARHVELLRARARDTERQPPPGGAACTRIRTFSEPARSSVRSWVSAPAASVRSST